MSERIKPIEDFIRETTIQYYFSREGDPLNKVARHIYESHIKPLEDALAKVEADKAALQESCKKLLSIAEQFSNASLMKGRSTWWIDEDIETARAALANVKEALCPKN